MVHTQDPMTFYLEAMKKFEKWNISETGTIVSLLKRVIELDPNFYRAYIELCNCYTWMGALNQISSQESSDKVNYYLALLKKLDHNLPEYYTLLAKRAFWIEWNIPTASRNCSRALEIQPNDYEALILKGLIAGANGNGTRALQFLQQAERMDPLARNINYFIGLIHLYNTSYEDALFYLDRNIAISPHWIQQYHEKVIVLCSLQRYSEAELLIETISKRMNSELFTAILKARLFAHTKQNDLAQAQIEIVLSKLDINNHQTHPHYSYLAEIFLLLKEYESSFHYLEMGIKCKATPFTFLKTNSLWDCVCEHPRFISAIESQFHSKKSTKEYSKSELTPKRADELIKDLSSIMEESKPWLESSLTRNDLATLLGVSSHKLSQLLNKNLNYTFHDYCNRYRLTHFLEIISTPDHSSRSILSTAIDSGFGSKTTFNSFFKKNMGTTPLKYLKSLQS